MVAPADTPNGVRVCSASEDGNLIIWDLATGNEVRRFSKPPGRLYTVTDDGRDAVVSNDGVIRFVQIETGAITRELRGHNGRVTALSISTDGKRLVSCSDWGGKGEIREWDLTTGELVRTVKVPWSCEAIAMLRDGRALIAPAYQETYGSFHDRLLKIWHIDRGVEVSPLLGHTRWVNAIALSVDGPLCRYRLG